MGLIATAALALLAVAPAWAQTKFITVASTTSTEASGLFRHLLPMFERRTGIGVRVVALGTGQALELGRRGDADVVLVHTRALEERFVTEGWGERRYAVMYNDFVLIGPQADPAKVALGQDAGEAFRRIHAARAPFVSRGDRSGTHLAELEIWKAAGIELSQRKGSWYRETGSGMGAALNTASAMNAYVLADRGSWLAFRNRGELVVLVEGDRRLFNEYGAILVNPQRHPAVKSEWGRQFIQWLVSAEGQAAIAAYRVGGGQPFFPAAGG